MSELYKQLAEDGINKGDTNFCTVIATAVVFDKSYEDANDYLKLHAKRPHRSGPTWENFEKAIKKLAVARGYNYKRYTRSEIRTMAIGKTMTVGNCLRYLNPKKRYVIGVRGHALSYKDGKIQDWTSGRRHRINKIFEVEVPADDRGVEVEIPHTGKSFFDTLKAL